jgi:hypothetical protein
MAELIDLSLYSPDELAYIATVAAVAISKGFTTDSINVLGSIFISIGGTLTIIAKQQALLLDIVEKENKVADITHIVETILKTRK